MKRLLFLFLCLIAPSLLAAPPARVIVEDADGTQHVYVPQDEPVVVPDEPTARPNIGINLAPARYWSSERPFNDLSKLMSPWHWSTTVGWNNAPRGPVNANGYPTSVSAGTYAGGLIDLQAGHPMGQYFVTPASALTVDGGSNGTWVKSQPSQRLLIRVRAGLESLSVRESKNDDTTTFYKPFLERTKKFGTLRFMDWAQTNEDRPITWESRVTPSWYTQADREVCIEYQIALAELCDASPWFCIHHRADDNYVRQMARLIKAEYDGTRPIYLEHSNEVWNPQFPAYRYCVERGSFGSPYEWHIQRTAHLARLFESEGVPVVCVLGCQAGAVDTFVWAVGRIGPIPSEIDALGIAPYFGGSITPAGLQSVDTILDECEASLRQRVGDVQKWVDVADRMGLKLVGYEGGQHLVLPIASHSDGAMLSRIIAANRHPRMGALYREYLGAWNSVTDHAVMCLFNSCEGPSKWGCWGLLEYEGQAAADSPKYQAVLDALEGPG